MQGLQDTYSVAVDTETIGLRERKKRATRAALSAAALQLSVERGADAVTIDDIAAHADVAPRTFFNYFSSKEEAILADGVERAQRMVSTLAQRPPAEPVWDALRNSFVEVIAEDVEPSREWVARGRLVRASPALASQYLANYATMERMLIDEVARRCDCVAADLYPRLVVATAVSAVRVAISHWIETTEGTTTLVSSIALALEMAATDLSSGHPPTPVPDRA